MMIRKFNELKEELKENMQNQFNDYQKTWKKNLRRHRSN
jgi:hypothetical protein